MTSAKSVTTEQRLNALIGNATDWVAMGSMSNGWTVGTTAKYRRTMEGLLVLDWDLNVGTFADGTVIWSAANGLPSGFRPINNQKVAAGSTDHMANLAGAGSETAAVILRTDGSVQILGMAGGATRMNVFGIFPLDG